MLNVLNLFKDRMELCFALPGEIHAEFPVTYVTHLINEGVIWIIPVHILTVLHIGVRTLSACSRSLVTIL